MIGLATSLLLLVAQANSGPVDRIIGLLTLPQVFGMGPCVPFKPQVVPLFAAPRESIAAASIEVDKYWIFPPKGGGCDGLEVRVHHRGREPEMLPTEEFQEEAPAAIVLARQGDWFRVKTTHGPLWLRGTASNVYYPLIKLLSEHSAYLTGDWDRSIFTSPSGSRVSTTGVTERTDVKVLGARTVSGDLWLLIETTSDSSTDSDRPSVPTVKGWLRAYGPNGDSAVWFYTRD